MKKDSLGPITGLQTTIVRFVGEDIEHKIMESVEKIKDAHPKEVAEWLKGAIDRLDKLVDEKTRTRIMEECGFNCARINRTHIARAGARRRRFKTLDEFIEAEQKNPMQGTRIERDGDIVYQYYEPLSTFNVRCYCVIWKGLPKDENVSPTWCQCSKGFVIKLWEAYVGRPVKVELLESCISGANECRFKVYLKENP